jgi:hypothetical protein
MSTAERKKDFKKARARQAGPRAPSHHCDRPRARHPEALRREREQPRACAPAWPV